ncbi:MAG: V-type ATP synthase subunit I [Nocardioides sp.]
MLVPITQLEVVGRRHRLDDVLVALQAARLAEVVSVLDSREGRESSTRQDAETTVEELVLVEQRVATLLACGPAVEFSAGSSCRMTPVEVQAVLLAANDAAEPLLERRERLREELESLPRTSASLGVLIPLVPEFAEMTDEELAQIHLATIALMLEDPDGAVVTQVRQQLDELLGDRALLVTTGTGSATGCLLVVPSSAVPEVESLLGQDRVERMALPEGFTGRSLRSTVADMQERIAALPALVEETDEWLRQALMPHLESLHEALESVRARRERLAASTHAEVTSRAFGVRLWVPRNSVRRVREAIVGVEPAAAVSEVPGRLRVGEQPILVRNMRWFRPFQSLVGFLSWPAPGGLDPTGLMAVALPLFFGIMVGDVGYGLALSTLGYALRRRYRDPNPVLADVGRVLIAGGLWATFFGLLFGEFLGDLGKVWFDMPAWWFYRGGTEALTPLLIFVLVLGTVHMTLGLLIGLWLAVRERHLPHALERGGTLVVFGGLFVIAAAAVAAIPGPPLPVGIALVLSGLVIAGVGAGPLGVLLGPLEVVGRIGNVLSYIRLAAVGLASVYLAVVANELARQAPLLLGIAIAAFFHVLNLALAAFSPMIQSLRLHYVEFFGTFHDGGGRPFQPLGADLAPVPHDVGPATVPAREPALAAR